MAKNKQKKNKGPAHRNPNFAQSNSQGNSATKSQDKKADKPLEAKAAKAEAQHAAQADSASDDQKSFFSNIINSIKKLVKQSS